MPRQNRTDGGDAKATPPRSRLVTASDTDVGAKPPEERDEIYANAKQAHYEIPALQSMPTREIVELARDAGVRVAPGMPRDELVFEILKHKVTEQGLGWGSGTLDILPDGFGFLRSTHSNYRPGSDDIYVSPSQIRRLNLRQGHVVAGPVRPPNAGEKYFALLHVERVGDVAADDYGALIPFEDLTPRIPSERLTLEHAGGGIDLRLIDLLAPIGRGQRTVVLAPPNCGRTMLLTNVARGILANHDDVYVILAMLDERPEEVTEVVQSTGPDDRREVLASTFDEEPAQHIALAKMAIEKACRMVECGHDVVLLLDSLTQLTRAYNTELPHSGKIVTPGLDQAALNAPKRLFGAARDAEDGGSLTVIATLLTDTDSTIDKAIEESFRGKANSEIVLTRELAELHLYPALDVTRTCTRHEDRLLDPPAVERIRGLRRELTAQSTIAAYEDVVARLEQTRSNREFLDGAD